MYYLYVVLFTVYFVLIKLLMKMRLKDIIISHFN